MTAPLTASGTGVLPLASLERLGTTPSAAALPADQAAVPFAGVLARLVNRPSATDANSETDAAAIVEAALASLDAAVADAAPTVNAGTSAIRALVELVTRKTGMASGALAQETTSTAAMASATATPSAPTMVLPWPKAAAPAPTAVAPAAAVAVPAQTAATPASVVAVPAPTNALPTPAVAARAVTVVPPAPTVAATTSVGAAPSTKIAEPALVVAAPASTFVVPSPVVATPAPRTGAPSSTTAVSTPTVTAPAPGLAVFDSRTAAPALSGTTSGPTVVLPALVVAAPAPRGDTQTAASTDEESGSDVMAPEASPTALTAPVVVTPGVDPSAVVREVAALDPALRAKLDRVVDRMQTEFGYKVTVTETVRSQDRQDALYEQGRSQPGPVVTWTRASRHAEGLAVDVMIDGGYDNPVAFARLQQVANEEGLHTLGARDPGHLELRTPQAGGFTARMATPGLDSTMMRSTPPASPPASTPMTAQAASETLARIARVAHVAEVAVTAGVAQVARIAVPGAATPRVADSVRARPTETKETPRVEMPPVAVTGAASTGKASAHEGTSDAGLRDRRTSEARVAAPVVPASIENTAPPMAAAVRPAPGIDAVHAVAGADQASRVARIDTLSAQADAQPVSSMVLNLENGDGGTDRIRVDLRGNKVTSTIDVRDQQSAADLSARTSDLTRALESRGLEADAVRVRTVIPERLATEASRPSLLGSSGSARSIAGALAADASNPSRREPDDRRDPREGSHTQQDSHRQRSRREREEYPQ